MTGRCRGRNAGRLRTDWAGAYSLGGAVCRAIARGNEIVSDLVRTGGCDRSGYQGRHSPLLVRVASSVQGRERAHGARHCGHAACTRGKKSPALLQHVSANPGGAECLLRHPETTQRGDLDITEWLLWFLACLNGAFDHAETLLAGVLAKADFWERHRDTPLNDRQTAVLNRLMDGFEGKLTSAKWAKLTKVSQDTASRDIRNLIVKGILRQDEGDGRNTSYSIVLSGQ
jgi:hypothetical protein